MVVVDTNILDLLLHAMRYGDFPRAAADVRDQQVATFRLFLWNGLGAVGSVPVNEVAKHPHPEKRDQLQRLIFNQLPEVSVQDADIDQWKTRADELGEHHRGRLDCELVAEAELVGALTLLTFDKTMIKNLRPHARVALCLPTEHWNHLQIPRGTPPRWTPTPSNPLSTAAFWRWD